MAIDLDPVMGTHGSSAEGLVVLIADDRFQRHDTYRVTIAHNGGQIALFMHKIGYHGEVWLATRQHMPETRDALGEALRKALAFEGASLVDIHSDNSLL